MSDAAPTTEQPDLSTMAGSPGQKRKRDAQSPETQRAKRTAPPAAMSADTAAFIENAIEATQAATAGGVNVADFSALQQAAAEHSEPTDASNATSTAQAALGMYPTLHVPASTEEQFAAQSGTDADQAHDASFDPEVTQPEGIMDASAVSSDQQQPPPPASNGVQPSGHRYPTSSSTSNPKPSVGSEEWHKMRKDNHKEGESWGSIRSRRDIS